MSAFLDEFLNAIYVVIFFLTLITIFSLLGVDFNTIYKKNNVDKIVSFETFGIDKTDVNADNSESLCEKYAATPHLIEEKCNTFSSQSCNAASCCVCLNGKKFVAGNKHGPTYFSDNNGNNIDILYYYHKNKCSGKCPLAHS